MGSLMGSLMGAKPVINGVITPTGRVITTITHLFSAIHRGYNSIKNWLGPTLYLCLICKSQVNMYVYQYHGCPIRILEPYLAQYFLTWGQLNSIAYPNLRSLVKQQFPTSKDLVHHPIDSQPFTILYIYTQEVQRQNFAR